MSFAAIVVGLGGMGSAAAWRLASRGVRVLGLDRYAPPHHLGSTHGRSRIIRMAYMEGAAYVPLLRRAYELWEELATGSDGLWLRTGGLMLGAADSQAVAGSLESARIHDLPHELLDAARIRERFPALRPDDDTVGLYEEIAGVLDPERCVDACLRAATAAGAELRMDCRVRGWQATDNGVRVETDDGDFEAAQLVLAAGPWITELLPAARSALRVTRQVMHWFRPTGGLAPFQPGALPVYIWEPEGEPTFYGFPATDGANGGVKVAIHHGGVETDPEHVDRQVSPEDVGQMRASITRRIPALDGEWLEGAVCLYTTAADQRFIMGRLAPRSPVVVATGFSGHGYKFATAVGDVIADLVIDDRSPLPIEPFSSARLEGA